MNLRKRAFYILSQVNGQGAYANLTLLHNCTDLSQEQARWLTALVYTTLDHLYSIDFYLSSLYSSRPKPALQNLLRLGACELLYFRTPSYSVVDAYVSLSKEIGKGCVSGFINGVLRSLDRMKAHLPAITGTPEEVLSITYSYPLWLVDQWVKQYGEGFTKELLDSPAAPLEVRAQYPCQTEELAALLPAAYKVGKYDDHCLILENGMNVMEFSPFMDGRMAIQSQSAMLACRALGDCRGKRVLDACAAPGGKSAYIASLSENTALLTCWEVHEHRKELLDKTLARLHVAAETAVKDACRFDSQYVCKFDSVLIDAPCSGLGLLNDKPDIRYQKTGEDIQSLAAVQRALLEACWRYVVPGGSLLYVTCTISRLENQDTVAAFLETHKEFHLSPMPVPIANDGMLQLFPNVHEVDGFFMARMKRCS